MRKERPEQGPLAYFGQHPNFDLETYQNDALRALSNGTQEFSSIITERELPISKLFNHLHPDIFIIPRNKFYWPIDEYGDRIGFEQISFPFSSTDFYVDEEREGGVFYEIYHARPFRRLSAISQLGYLVPPRPKEWGKEIDMTYLFPQFPQTRWIHSLLTAIIMEIVLARNNFSEKERASAVLTAGFHDIATPAGGDSTKRIDFEGLDEEKNFAWVLEYYGLDKRWEEKFGFNLADAERWVAGEGKFGPLLDFIDKISYTAIDCFYLGMNREGKVRKLCLNHPLVMDIWQDIIMLDGKFIFSNHENLFNFLLLRMYEFQELLYNPYSRVLDLFLKNLAEPLYRKGIITREQLLTEDDNWLHTVLEKHYPGKMSWIIEPEKLSWKKFSTEEEQKKFCKKLGPCLSHAERIFKFNTGLDFPVLNEGEVIPLREALPKEKTEMLEKIAASMMGYYVYYTQQAPMIRNSAYLQI